MPTPLVAGTIMGEGGMGGSGPVSVRREKGKERREKEKRREKGKERREKGEEKKEEKREKRKGKREEREERRGNREERIEKSRTCHVFSIMPYSSIKR